MYVEQCWGGGGVERATWRTGIFVQFQADKAG
jgi:hypothetical protein